MSKDKPVKRNITREMPVDFWNYSVNPITGFIVPIKNKSLYKSVPYENLYE